MVKTCLALLLIGCLLIGTLAAWSQVVDMRRSDGGVSEVWKFVAIGAISAVLAGGATPLVWGFSIDRRIAELRQSIALLEEFRRWFDTDFKADWKLLRERAHTGVDLGSAAKAELGVVHDDLKEIKQWIRALEARVNDRDGRSR